MRKFATIFLCILYIKYGQATYNSGIKTRAYTQEQPITQVVHHQHQHQYQYTPTHGNYYHQQQNSNCDKCDNDYRSSITQQQHDNVYQQQQQQPHYQPISHQTQNHYQQQQPQSQPQYQPQSQPIYERREGNSLLPATGNLQNSPNAVNEFYTGCPSGYTGQLPYAYDCRRFLNCWHGRGYIQTCSIGTVFNPETFECDRPDKAKCEAALSVLGQSSNKLTSHGTPKSGRYTGASTETVEVLCSPDAKGLQPHPSDCTRFINCANGNMHIQQCGPGTAYSIPMKVCDFKDKVDCTGREGGTPFVAQSQDNGASSPPKQDHEQLPHNNDILCPKGITGLFAYPFDYTKFIHCKNGNTAIQNCVPNTAFSISKGFCEPLTVIQPTDHVIYIVSQVSYEYSQTLIACPPGTEGLHLYPFNAEKFVRCVQSQMEVVPCSVSQVFSITRRHCLPLAQVLKHERVRLLNELRAISAYNVNVDDYSIQNMIYCPGGLTGTYPNPFDSTRYLKCVSGRLYSESCASGQAYSLSRKLCDLKEEINVSDRVPLIKAPPALEWNISDMEITHGSIDGLTYLMCPPGLDGYYLHPFDCTKYIECKSGATAVDECAQGTVFSISRQECIPRDKVEAYDRVEYMTTTTNEFTNESRDQYNQDLSITCSPGRFGIYPHPQDCHKYMRCANGRLSVEDCPAGQVFSVSRSYCHNENEVDLRDRSSYNRGHKQFNGPITGSTHTVHQTGSYGPGNAIPAGQSGSYKPAVSVPPTSMLPPPRPVINPPPVVLAPPLPTQSLAPTLDEATCPPEATGRYPHPYDCRKFLMCTNGKTHIQDCGPGTAWNRAMEVCDFINNVKECSTNSISRGAGTTTDVGASQSPYTCPEGIEGLYQHPYDWHKYLVCSHGQTTIMDCAPGTVFSVSRKICDLEANVLNDDRCNNGVYSSSYDYSYSSSSNNRGSGSTQWSSAGSQNPPTTYTQVTENRWHNMNLPRPQPPAHDHTTTWQHTTHTQRVNPPARPEVTPVWSGTAEHVDQRNPTHTIIYEEGSFEPNRNYNPQILNSPFAPLAPTTSTSTTTPATVVYAQPVGSQEDSKEIFSHEPPKTTNVYYPSVNRQNHTRHINTWIPIRPVEIPRHDLMPSPPVHGHVYTNTGVLVPVITPGRPPQQPNPERPLYHRPIYNDDDKGQVPLAEGDFKLPGQKTYVFNGLDQLPSASSRHNANDATNLYGGLQPPLSNTPSTTPYSVRYLPPYEQTTQIPEPAKTPISPPHIPGYPHLTNASIRTFPHQPHYSPPYSEVTHSRNASWFGRKVPPQSGIKSTSSDNVNVKITSPTPNHYYGLDSPPPANIKHEKGENLPNHDQDEEQIMKEALKLLLKPYLDPDNKIDDDEMAEKAQSHIMSLVVPPTTTSTTTHKTPPSNKNTLSPSTTTLQPDVELILAGEQHNLLGVTTTKTGDRETTTAYSLYQSPLESERSSALPHQLNHVHNPNWHKNHHNHHHTRHQHNREFHERHPNLPNPFAENPNRPTPINPRAESTTPTNLDFDLRAGGVCPFACGNGKCIEQHQVCDGVNNCGNRKDEQQCDHLGYDIRLTGGETSNMGRVEVKILGKWGYVCDDKFGLHDADVVCHELGFKMGAMEVRGNSYYPPTDVNLHFVMDEVQCKGNETSLKECDFKGWGVNNCGPDEVVGVVCKVAKLKCPDNYWLCSTSKECIPTAFLCDITPDCEDGSDESEQVCNAPIKYRLEGGRSSNEGRLEVFYRGEWGTVCDDDFGLKEAQVVCNSFGFYGKPEIAKNIYGPGSGPIWLDQVSCLGNETRIDECSHWTWGENNCNHTEDVGIKCKAGPKPPTRANGATTSLIPAKDSNFNASMEFEQSELDDLGLYQGLWQRSSKSINSQKKCGHFKTNLIDEYDHPEERVVNGSIAKRGRHPWQATIRTRGRGGISSHWCGAVIISKKLILTAAHCLAGYPKGSYFVRMGDHYANIAESSEIDVNIENWYIHEKFRDQKHMNNDIALILLKTAIRFNDYVQPICLPDKDAVLETDRMCTISGWGSIKSGTSTPSNILRSAQVPILADAVCSQKNVYANAMTEGMFCAGFLDESADACDGDSGGPLVCSDEDGETLYGIISWGQHCGYANHPGVYVRVQKYIDWIYEKINLMLQQGKL